MGIPLKPIKETLKILVSKKKKVNYNVEKMKISQDKILLIYNHELIFFIPNEAWGYEVNGRTPLEWLVDQYKDYSADDNHLICLIEKCIAVTVRSKTLIDGLLKIPID